MNGTMPYETTIDSAGRVVIPKPLRKRLGLRAGERLALEEQPGAIVVRPRRAGPVIRREAGILVVYTGGGPIDIDHREIREEYIDHLTR